MIHPRFGPRALMAVDGQPLIQRALGSRAWKGQLRPEDYVFVLREAAGFEPIEAFLRANWPGCAVVKLSRLTGGAMLSAVAGMAQASVDCGPVIVDLADILFEGGLPREGLTAWPGELGGVAPCFTSRDPAYSYLRLADGRVVETAEKRVISDLASAGVYMFRDIALYLAAAAHSLARREELAHSGALFVCPMMNGVVEMGLEVRAVPVVDVVPIGKLFH